MSQAASPDTYDRPSPVVDAFEALFLREHGRVVGIARRVTRDEDEAFDVAQEVFLAALRAGVAGRPGAEGWLVRAAVHVSLNHLRGARRRERRERTDAVANERFAAGPEGDVERREEQRWVREALARLPARQAAILVLRHGGLRYDEVARTVGVRVGSVGTLLRRAEQALREELLMHASDGR